MSMLRRAELMMTKRRYILAFEYFMEYFNTTPSHLWDRQIEDTLIDILGDLEIYLNNKISLENLLKCFLYPVNWFPLNIKANYMFGGMLLRSGDFELAEWYLSRAWPSEDVKVENQISIDKRRACVAWNLVPRWNFRWLNSLIIQNAYRKAILKALDEGYTDAINLGSGCDHLSLYAGSHKSCSSIVSVEINDFLRKKGKSLVAKYCSHITHKSFLRIGKMLEARSDKPGPFEGTRDLVFVDAFDSGFFSYGILPTLYVCLCSMMKAKFKVIPSKVKFYITGIFSDDLYKKFRLQNVIPIIKVDDECVTKLNDTYRHDTEIYVWYKYEILTETKEFLNISLDDKASLVYFFEGKWCQDIHLVGIKKGIINCLLLRYDIYLDDEISISNDPFKSDNEIGFEHAIFHCRHPILVKPNEKVNFKAKTQFEQFSFLSKFDENPLLNQTFCNTCFTMSEEAIAFLNDKKLINYIIKLSEHISNESKLYIVDFSDFPLMGLLLAKRGHQIYYFYPDSEVLNFVGYLMEKNEIDASRIIFMPYYQHIIFVPNLKKLDHIFYVPVHQDGSMKLSPLRNLVFKDLKPTTILGNHLVHFVLVYSNCLKNFNEIDSSEVEPFDGLTFLNDYSTAEQPFFSKMDHQEMSEHRTWRIFSEKVKKFSVKIFKKGKINGIMVWYTMYGSGNIGFSTKDCTSISKYAFRFQEKQVEINDEIEIEGKFELGHLLSLAPSKPKSKEKK